MGRRKYEMELPTDFLSKIAEFDRTKKESKIETLLYSSSNTIKAITKDIKNGIGIKNPVQVIVSDNKALMVQGCHRLVAAKQAGLKKVPAVVVFLRKLVGKWEKMEPKMVDI